jgi:rare lipoprotein A (RlpA)-like double-psi beta-barrel protein
VSPALAQRALLLAAVTLLGGVIALSLADRLSDSAGSKDLPEAVAPPGGGWYEALAGVESRRVYGRPTACGHVLERSTMGFAHPVLPCGAKIYLGHAGKEVLTQVVARGPTPGGVQFGLTEALARELGIRGRGTIRWRFARRA